MKIVLLSVLSAFALTACVYAPADYVTGPVHGDAKKIVERIMYEQPENKRPEYVEVHDDYLEFGDSTSDSASDTPICGSVGAAMLTGGISCMVHHGQDKTKRNVTRVYYRTIAETKLLNRVSAKGHWYVVEPRSARGRTLVQVYVDDKADAENFADALMALKVIAPTE